MSGIREPKKDGGMLLVGEHPKEFRDASGREKHVAPIVYGAGMGLARLAPLAMRGARALKGLFGSTATRSTTGNFAGPMKRFYEPAGYSGKVTEKIFTPNKFSKYFIDSPEGRLLAGSTGFAGKVGKKAFQGAKYLASSPLTVGGGLIYAGGKFFKDGKEVPPPPNAAELLQGRVGTSGAPGGGDPGMYLEPQTKKGGGVELSAEELRKKNVERYRDIMDIKGMNKDAAYKSLISASQLINESGDFKGDIKSGKLINQIIQATSKNFDKPKATKDAIDTLILKGEIEKDINASDPKSIADLAYKEAATKKLNKELKGNTTAEIIQARMLKDDMPSGSNLASLISINNPELNVKVLPTKDLGNADPVDYMTKIVATVNADETTPDYPSGVYVLKDKVIQITEEGAVVPVPISALK
jgi:hypothetical protein